MQAAPVRIQLFGMVINNTACSLLGELKGGMFYIQFLGISPNNLENIAACMHHTMSFLFVERN